MKNSKILLSALISVFVLGCASPARLTNDPRPEPRSIRWVKVGQELKDQVQVAGLPWFEENQRFTRLPNRLEEKVKSANPIMWNESLRPSGARVRFKTNSSFLVIRMLHGVGDDQLAGYHMAQTSVAGTDLFVGPPGKEVFRGVAHPRSGSKAYEHLFFLNADSSTKDITLYLPTYAEVKTFEVGVDPGAKIEAPSPYRHQRSIVFYGTSITQSAASSRSSSGFVPLLARLLNTDVINLGFSGSAKSELFTSELLASLDASVYVIDPVANMGERRDGKTLMELNYRAFVEDLRRRKPKTPIVLMTRIRTADFFAEWGEMNLDTDESYRVLHQPLYETYQAMKKKGDKNVYLFETEKVIPRSAEHPSVEGLHLTDKGFWDLAQALKPVLGKLIH